MEYHIKTTELGKTYKKFFSNKSVTALKSLSIEVPAGTVMGFLGMNGAGKTTTIKLLLGLIKPTQGSAELMGLDISNNNSRIGVSYMPESANLNRSGTARKLLTTTGLLSKMDEIEIKKRIDEVISEVGLEGKEDIPFGNLSKGMKQRILLSQAIFTKPKLLILDEPFSGLDPVKRRDVRDLIVKYNKKFGTTVFFSSHILSDVEVMCDSISILHNGELKAIGTKEDLLGIETYEVLGNNINSNGILFIEKMSDSITKKGEQLSAYINPSKDPEKIVKLFEKYGATDIKLIKHTRNLEKFFSEVVEGS